MAERFALLSEVGRGGMGIVWKARDEQTGQIVALKVLHPVFAADPGYVTRFERELELARRIHSRNVVHVFGYGVRQGSPYLALEFVDGPSLRERLTTHGAYPWPEARVLLAQIAQGLADAHAAGVLHRDLKPSNVLIGSDGIARLADFGIARGLDLTRVTATSTMLGTPAYLAPEGPLDERSDLYSLGVLAYELLTGAPPFEGPTYQSVLLAHLRTPPDLAKLPPPARQMVGRLLAKDPARRIQRATELVSRLGATSAGATPVPSPAPSAPHPAAMRVATAAPVAFVPQWRRRPVLVGFGVIACLLVAVSVGLAGAFLSSAYRHTPPVVAGGASAAAISPAATGLASGALTPLVSSASIGHVAPPLASSALLPTGLVSPANGSSNLLTVVTLAWNIQGRDGDSTTYDVYLGTANPPASAVSHGLAETSLRLPGLSPSTTYYWKVVATSGPGVLAVSSVWTFTTSNSPFVMTPALHHEIDDLDSAVANEIGSGYRVADWSDVTKYCETHTPLEFASLLSWSIGSAGLLVTNGGADYWSGDRHYFVERHDHVLPSGWLSHANVDNHFIDLGSWYGMDLHVLAIKK